MDEAWGKTARWKVKIVRKKMNSWRVMLLCWAEQKCIKRTKNSVLRRQCILLSIKVKVKVVNFWNSMNWRFELLVKIKYHQKKGLLLQTLVISTRFWHFTSLTFILLLPNTMIRSMWWEIPHAHLKLERFLWKCYKHCRLHLRMNNDDKT